MALAYYAMGQKDALLIHAERSLHLSRQLNIHTHMLVSNALLAICHLSADPVSALVHSQNALEQCAFSDPEQYRPILIILEEICRHEAQEPSNHIIDGVFENSLERLPVPRRIEGWLYLAQYWVRMGQNSKAKELAHKANQMATRRKMLTHALRSRRIISALSQDSDSLHAHEQFTDLRTALVEPLSEIEKNQRHAFLCVGIFPLIRSTTPSNLDTHIFYGQHDVYTAIRVVGRGAMATVYLCENTNKERVALKWLTQNHELCADPIRSKKFRATLAL